MITLLLSVLSVLSDTIELPLAGYEALGHFRMCFSDQKWRGGNGSPKLFPTNEACEIHFFWEGEL